MPTSAVGNNRLTYRATASTGRGFTLVELLVVLALMAVIMGGATLALRDSASSALERDATRLAAMLEAARLQARASDVPAVADVAAQGVRIRGFEWADTEEERVADAWRSWLSDATRPVPTEPIVLGPEPLLPPRQIQLVSAVEADTAVWVVTDGLRPWHVRRGLADEAGP